MYVCTKVYTHKYGLLFPLQKFSHFQSRSIMSGISQGPLGSESEEPESEE